MVVGRGGASVARDDLRDKGRERGRKLTWHGPFSLNKARELLQPGPPVCRSSTANYMKNDDMGAGGCGRGGAIVAWMVTVDLTIQSTTGSVDGALRDSKNQ